MKLKLLVSTILVLALGLNTAEAQPGRGVQRHRIEQGVRSGELTRVETRNLVIRQRNLRCNIRRAKSDGVITRRERLEIRRYKRMNNQAIYRSKHNQRNRI